MAKVSGQRRKPDSKTASARTGLPAHHSRAVDLGREEELITWSDWFARSMDAMFSVIEKKERDRLVFRVTLRDGRSFLVTQAHSHMVRGRCTLEKSRWSQQGAVCDIITGYLLIGIGEDELLTAVCVPPREIASVECVLAPQEDESPAPFGFYKREGLRLPATQTTVEESLTD